VNIFLTNQKGFPVLSKAHQAVVKRLFGYVHGSSPTPNQCID
jgi:hypothetical protein